MADHMNPDFPKQRGCFITPKGIEMTDACTVVDYPTWSLKNNRAPFNANLAVPDGIAFEKKFASKAEALEFCKAENYVPCSHPKTEEELAEIRAKREAFYASRNATEPQDEFDF